MENREPATKGNRERRVQVLLIDDDPVIRKATKQWLNLANMDVDDFAGAPDALVKLHTDANVVIVSEIKMPGMDGMELAHRCHLFDPDLPVLLITAQGDIRMAVDAIRIGAYDVIEKPFEPELLAIRIRRAWEKRQLVLKNRKSSVTSNLSDVTREQGSNADSGIESSVG